MLYSNHMTIQITFFLNYILPFFILKVVLLKYSISLKNEYN